MAGRKYTPEQTAARLAWTREWRKRNKERIRAWEAKNATKRKAQRRRRYRANPEKFQDIARASAHRRAQHRRQYMREYRRRKLAANPNWAHEQRQSFLASRPGYWSMAAKRRQARLAMAKFAKACAASRLALSTHTSGQWV